MYREEYPRPTMVRKDWENLNGSWHFEIAGNAEDYLYQQLSKVIEVPFCPESKLSGIEYKGFMTHVYYRKTVKIPEEKLRGRVILHFGAVDYESRVYINKQLCMSHKGGYTGFSTDITSYLIAGDNVIDVEVFDDTKSLQQPSGKQSTKEESYFCMYTRCTGIWQSVWLEYVSNDYIKDIRVDALYDNKCIDIFGSFSRPNKGQLIIEVSFDGEIIMRTHEAVSGDTFNISVPIDNLRLWSPEHPNLYDINISYIVDDRTCDSLDTYCGFRKIEIVDKHLYINGDKVMLRQVLDQGYYPDGIYTAPTLQDIYKDIDIGLQYGFNGARPHQKVFEEHYLSYCDRMGYLVWGEYPNWSAEFTKRNPKGVANILSEWSEVIDRDYMHPSIIGWCPLNEAWAITSQKCDYSSQKAIVELTKTKDQTRPVIGASGGDYYITDIFDMHTYTHNCKTLKRKIKSGIGHAALETLRNILRIKSPKQMRIKRLKKLPLFVSEYGGITFAASGKTWGYNQQANTQAEFIATYRALTQTLIDADVFGYCYTQLTDVEQEQNGLVHYDRTPKLSAEGIRQIRDINKA